MDGMMQTKEFLKKIISLPGISGYESVVCDAIAEEWKQLTDETQISKIGNLYGVKKGCARKDGQKNRRILAAVHMDGIGMIVHSIEQEFLFFAPVGGLDARILVSQFVVVHGRDADYPGLIVQPSPNLLPEELKDKPVPLNRLMIDVGMTPEEVSSKIHVGDTISFMQKPMEMGEACVAGHSLDNRASVAALTQCLRELQRVEHAWDFYAVATVQEETEFLGAYTSPYDIRPDIAVAIDVTFAKGPGAAGWRTKELESGPSLGIGANIHPALYNIFRSLCEEMDIPYTTDIMPGMSGTDAYALQVAVGPTPTMVISIPLRYMHTPVEVISMKDVMRTGRLLAAFISRLDDEILDQLVWEDEK